jgi:hypothetical protein
MVARPRPAAAQRGLLRPRYRRRRPRGDSMTRSLCAGRESEARVPGDTTRAVTKARRGGVCSRKEAREVATRSTAQGQRRGGREGHARWCVHGCKGHREVMQ